MTNKDIEKRFNSEACIKFLNDCNKDLFDTNDVVNLHNICCC